MRLILITTFVLPIALMQIGCASNQFAPIGVNCDAIKEAMQPTSKWPLACQPR